MTMTSGTCISPGTHLVYYIPVCRKSMDSVDIVHGHCPAGVLERGSMDNVH